MKTMTESDARRILCVPESASFEEIKKARSALIHTYHPDLATSDPASQKRAFESMLQIDRAWKVIQENESQGVLGFPLNASPSKLVPLSLLDFIGVSVKQDQLQS